MEEKTIIKTLFDGEKWKWEREKMEFKQAKGHLETWFFTKSKIVENSSNQILIHTNDDKETVFVLREIGLSQTKPQKDKKTTKAVKSSDNSRKTFAEMNEKANRLQYNQAQNGKYVTHGQALKIVWKGKGLKSKIE